MPHIEVGRRRDGSGIQITATTQTGARPYLNVGWHNAYVLAEQLINLIEQHRNEKQRRAETP